MKKLIYSSASLPAKPVIGAEEDEAPTLDDKIDNAKDDFDYILDGLLQLDPIQANEILNDIHDYLQQTISSVAEYLA